MIDLEQRRWSSEAVLAKMIMDQESMKCRKQSEEIKLAMRHNRKKKDPLMEMKAKNLDVKAAKLTAALTLFKKKEMPQSSVEYRPLFHPDSTAA